MKQSLVLQGLLSWVRSWHQMVARWYDTEVSGVRCLRSFPLPLSSFNDSFVGAFKVQWVKMRGKDRR